jgi:hypothetical protein
VKVPREPTPWDPNPSSWWTWLHPLRDLQQRFWAPNKPAAEVTPSGWVVYAYDPNSILSPGRVAEGPETGQAGRDFADQTIAAYITEVLAAFEKGDVKKRA